jgi:hypothetical protein
VSAGAFRVILRFLYAHVLPSEEDYTREKSVEGVTAGEMVKIDLFQAKEIRKQLDAVPPHNYASVTPSRVSLLITTMDLMD